MFGNNRHGPKIGGFCVSFCGESWVPSNTLLPGPRSTSIPNAILIDAAVWPQQRCAENWGAAAAPPFFWGGGAGSPYNTTRPGPRSTSIPSGIFSHPAAAAPLFWGSWVPIYHNAAWAEAYLHTKWNFEPSSRLVTTDVGQKLGAAVPLCGESWVPSNTMSPGPRSTSIPSGILIHAAVWPQ